MEKLLKAIVDATKAGGVHYVTKDESDPLVEKGFIQINSTMADPNDPTKRAARATPEGIKAMNAATATTSNFAIMDNIPLPTVKRGGGGNRSGNPPKYDFDNMAIGQSFFVGNSQVKSGDATKSLGSAVSAANARYAEKTGETETKNRVKRGKDHKAVKDAEGNNVYESVTVDKTRQTRKFAVRKVEAGTQLGSWTAPETGALVQRIAVD